MSFRARYAFAYALGVIAVVLVAPPLIRAARSHYGDLGFIEFFLDVIWLIALSLLAGMLIAVAWRIAARARAAWEASFDGVAIRVEVDLVEMRLLIGGEIVASRRGSPFGAALRGVLRNSAGRTRAITARLRRFGRRALPSLELCVDGVAIEAGESVARDS